MQEESNKLLDQDPDAISSLSRAMNGRLEQGFQRVTVSPRLAFPTQLPTTSPGSLPEQTGPSSLISMGDNGAGIGQGAPNIFNLLQLIPGPSAPTAHPDSVPPIGPEERIRYSCLSGKCIQDPNGIYLGIDECLQDGCGSLSPGGGSGQGCDCGCGPSQTVLKVEVTGITSPGGGLSSGGRTYWTYSWVEIGPSGRQSSQWGAAINVYELSMDDTGGNDYPPGTLVSRKRIPNGAVVALYFDENCDPWFERENPLSVGCE